MLGCSAPAGDQIFEVGTVRLGTPVDTRGENNDENAHPLK